MAEGTSKRRGPDPTAKLRAENAMRDNEQKEERKNYLAWAIYAMAFFFLFDILYLHVALLGFVGFFATMFGSLIESWDTSGWVPYWAGIVGVIKIGDFVVSAAIARFLARQK